MKPETEQYPSSSPTSPNLHSQDIQDITTKAYDRFERGLLPSTDAGRIANGVLEYWFGTEDPWDVSYSHRGGIWFRGGTRVDQEVTQQFGDFTEKILEGEYQELEDTPHGKLALILASDQFTRHIFRGSAKMFSGDHLAIQWAQSLIASQLDKALAPVERLFVYFALEHSEDIQVVLQSMISIGALIEACHPTHKGRFQRMFRVAKQHHDLLKKFGRYPHRNALLGRVSTPEEEAFLSKTRFAFVHSVKARDTEEKNAADTFATDVANEDVLLPEKGDDSRRLNILVLHSFRQNARVMRSRTRKMRKSLEDIADLTFANAPLPYAPKGEVKEAVLAAFGKLRDTEHQRCWWNASEDNSVYHGIELSFAYIDYLCRNYGPFDGIIGFSQGGALAGLLAAMQPFDSVAFRFAICISGFPSRAEAHRALLEPASIEIPSLHVVGSNDILVDPERTLSLSKSFKEPVVIQHDGGHFVPDRWPLEEIKDFVSQFCHEERILQPDDIVVEGLSVEQKCAYIRQSDQPFAMLRHLSEASSKAILSAEQIQTLFREGEVPSLSDCLCGVRLLKSHFASLEGSDNEAFRTLGTALLQAHSDEKVYLRYLLSLTLFSLPIAEVLVEEIPLQLGWKALQGLVWEVHYAQRDENAEHPGAEALAELCGLDFARFAEKCQGLHNRVVSLFRRQLQEDLELLKRLEAAPESALKTGQSKGLWPSDCALYAPKRRSSIDKVTGFARDIAYALNPLRPAKAVGDIEEGADPLGYTKQIANRLYRKALGALRTALRQLSLQYADHQYTQRRHWFLEKERTSLDPIETPLAAAILYPEPEPVLPSTAEALEPLFAWLATNQHVHEPTAFSRGTLLPDGRLDLCKQVVGPDGIQPLLQSMKVNTQVKRLLLGNNIVGDEGAKAISAYIKSGDSILDIWYIAGNDFSHRGIQYVADALAEDKQVRHLWLKRNPIGVEGAKHIGELLAKNDTLEVLDLVNCGILDDGLKYIVDGLMQNQRLEHLYLCANGLGMESVGPLVEYLKHGSGLKTLFLSCNRLGPEGAKRLSEGLLQDRSLERLSLSSNRLGPEGTRYICEALKEHPTLLHLDLGYMRGTDVLGERGNFIGDEGAFHVADLIASHPVLRSVDLLHNDISQTGFNALLSTLRENRHLVNLRITQFRHAHNEYAKEELKSLLARNRSLVKDERELREKVLQPTHIEEILSVYRTK